MLTKRLLIFIPHTEKITDIEIRAVKHLMNDDGITINYDDTDRPEPWYDFRIPPEHGSWNATGTVDLNHDDPRIWRNVTKDIYVTVDSGKEENS